MTRAEFLAALDAHVHALVELRAPEQAATIERLRRKLERVESERDFLRAKIDAETEVERERLQRLRGPDLVTLAEVRRVVACHDRSPARKASLHERIARTLLARMEAER